MSQQLSSYRAALHPRQGNPLHADSDDPAPRANLPSFHCRPVDSACSLLIFMLLSWFCPEKRGGGSHMALSGPA